MVNSTEPIDADVVVVGGGIVGLAVAWAARQRHPNRRIVVLEQEHEPAHHQSGRNSGVLHSGLYYRPGSSKAELAVRGRAALVEFAVEHRIPHRIGGKVVVATRLDQRARLDELARRGAANGVQADRLGPNGIADHEPHAVGIAGLFVPETGVIDYRAVVRRLAELGPDDLRLGWKVIELVDERSGVSIHTDHGTVRAGQVVACAGLWADKLATGAVAPMPGPDRPGGPQPPNPPDTRPGRNWLRIVAFRGEYHRLGERAGDLVRELIYPVPDPDLPFLGVHLSRGIDGEVHAGPNAVLALARDGYTWGRVDPAEVAGLAINPALWRLAGRYWRVGIDEVIRSWSRRRFADSVSELVPEITADDLTPSPAGVRAQALRRDGSLVDDFVLARTGRITHVLNAPSPAATASLAIGERVAEELR
ncbi:FAD-dependent oxidoreductase [Candidatus Neomicrothrix sp.]|uniref:FAD-dependent oxidoreductase n=1 Tax=Candidatus Neomicrothrix sp. TaxID=2719034 RepID=UPI001B5D4E47|nr:FAD-dependent oxidoreductase [Candidatus Microthrix sp.]MBP8956505.1 FAD-dependent oxidoreductase [Candidatus Microthrix sp.]